MLRRSRIDRLRGNEVVRDDGVVPTSAVAGGTIVRVVDNGGDGSGVGGEDCYGFFADGGSDGFEFTFFGDGAGGGGIEGAGGVVGL